MPEFSAYPERSSGMMNSFSGFWAFAWMMASKSAPFVVCGEEGASICILVDHNLRKVYRIKPVHKVFNI
jgi:hypothetical protein